MAHPSQPPRRLRRLLVRAAVRAGFTLIELMIAVVIGAFVVSALYALFVGQMRQFMYQDLQMEMHQNMRLGMDILTRTVRMAGYGTGSPDGAYTDGVFGDGGDNNAALSSIISYDGTGPNGADAITVVSMDPALVFDTYETSPPPCGSTSLTVVPSVNDQQSKLEQLSNGELLLCVDYAGIGHFTSYLWSMDGAPDAANGVVSIASGSTYADFETACPSTSNLPMIMTCSRAEVATFYIDANDSDGVGSGSADHPVLMMDLDFQSPDDDDIPVVDNVEDFQVAYCLKPAGATTDCADGGPDWSDTIPAGSAKDVYMVRLSLVVRSSRPDLSGDYQGAPLSVENNAPSATPDHYYRQLLTTRVAVRNLRLQANL